MSKLKQIEKVPDPDIVEFLERTLARAKRGEISTFVAVWQRDDELCQVILGLESLADTYKHIGMMDVLRHAMSEGVLDSYFSDLDDPEDDGA